MITWRHLLLPWCWIVGHKGYCNWRPGWTINWDMCTRCLCEFAPDKKRPKHGSEKE